MGLLEKKRANLQHKHQAFAHGSPWAPRGLFAGRGERISSQPNTFSISLINARKASLKQKYQSKIMILTGPWGWVHSGRVPITACNRTFRHEHSEHRFTQTQASTHSIQCSHTCNTLKCSYRNSAILHYRSLVCMVIGTHIGLFVCMVIGTHLLFLKNIMLKWHFHTENVKQMSHQRYTNNQVSSLAILF